MLLFFFSILNITFLLLIALFLFSLCSLGDSWFTEKVFLFFSILNIFFLSFVKFTCVLSGKRGMCNVW